jgi:hypothetical protein
MTLEIKESEWGLANNFGDYIEVNKHLKEFPELYDQIIEHEQAHSSGAFTKDDFILDLSPSKVNTWRLFKFMCIYPKTFTQFAPFYFSKNKEGKRMFVYDVATCIVYGVLIGIVGTIVTVFH